MYSVATSWIQLLQLFCLNCFETLQMFPVLDESVVCSFLAHGYPSYEVSQCESQNFSDKSNKYAMTRNWGNQNPNSALKTKRGKN